MEPDKLSEQQSQLLEDVLEHLAAGTEAALGPDLAVLAPAVVASLLESLPLVERKRTWSLVPAPQQGEVLAGVGDEVRATLIEGLAADQLIEATKDLEDDDLTDVIGDLPEEMVGSVLDAMDADRRHRLERVLEYEQGTAGRLMNSDVVSVRPDVSLAVVLRYLRRIAPLPVDTDAIMVVDDAGGYLGILPLTVTVSTEPSSMVADAMVSEADSVTAGTSEDDVAARFEQQDLISLAVVDDNHRLLGRITVDDVVDVIRQQSEQRLLYQAGLDEEEDLFAPILNSIRRRALWLGINLLTVLLASWVIGQFEGILDQVVALAVLMPIVASMGGIAGNQALTLTIRGVALNQITLANFRWFARKEVAIGLLNGLLWALVIAIVTTLWFHRWDIAAIIGAAMVINLLAGAASGVGIPLLLKRLRIDPALAGAVILTTATDVIGFAGFLGLATLVLL